MPQRLHRLRRLRSRAGILEDRPVKRRPLLYVDVDYSTSAFTNSIDEFIEHEDLPLSQELVERCERWTKAYDRLLDADMDNDEACDRFFEEMEAEQKEICRLARLELPCFRILTRPMR